MSIYSEHASNVNRINERIAQLEADKIRRKGDLIGGTLSMLGQVPLELLRLKEDAARRKTDEARLAQRDQLGQIQIEDALSSREAKRQFSDALRRAKTPVEVEQVYEQFGDLETADKVRQRNRKIAASRFQATTKGDYPTDYEFLKKYVTPEELSLLPKPEEYPDTPDFSWKAPIIDALTGTVRPPTPPQKPGEDYSLGPGGKRFNAQNQEVASVPPTTPVARPPAPPNVGSFEDFVIRKYGEKPTADQIAAARKVYNQADDRPFAPVVIQTGTGPQILDRGTGTTAPIKDASGAVLEPAPTADMRNKAEGRRLVSTSIKALESLSQKVITKIGPAQRLDASKRGIDAVLGNDPEFRTYQDARMALAGNLAVGQQGSRPSDADIRAIWLPMVPDVFRDTTESAKMKWELIRLMSNSPATAEGAPPPAGAAPAAVPSYQDYLRSKGGNATGAR